jgi:response regulator RpfG family c-di-GMP phosphodiesterase
MEKIRTTLLISDDLDDHQSFTEAFQKVSPSMVVIAVLSQDKATDLLMSRKLIPDYVFLDVSSPDSNASKFLSKVKMAEDGKKISVTVYGGEDDFLSREVEGVSKFDKDYEFPQLIKFFENLLDQHGG